MSGKMVIDVGTTADDGTGDPLRLAMQKANFNFTEIYDTTGLDANTKNLHVANTIFLGNSSVNGALTATSYSGNAYNADNLRMVDGNFFLTNNESRDISGNLHFLAANTYFDRGLFVNSVVVANTSGIYSGALVNAVSGNFGSLNVVVDTSISGNLTVQGDVMVAGQTTFVNATIVTTKNKNMVVAKDVATAALANGSGWIVGTYANLVYNNVESSMSVNVNFTAASNNLALGSNTNVWNIYANNVNAAAYTVGSSFVANTSRTTINELDVTGNTTSNNLFVNNFVLIGANVGYNFFTANTIVGLQFKESQNAFIQAVIQNANNGVNATGDLVLASDTGNDVVNYVNFGIGSSTYSNLQYSIHGPQDAYLFSANSNLVIGTASANSIIFHTGNTLDVSARVVISPSGYVGIGNNNPGALLVVSEDNTLYYANSGFTDLEFITQFASRNGAKNQIVLDSNTGSYIAGRNHGGTSLYPNNTPAGAVLIALNTRGYGNSDWIANTTGEIALVAEETFTSTRAGTYVKISTTNDGTIGATEKMRVMAGGNTGIGNTAPIDLLRVEGTHSVLTSITLANASQNAFVSNTTGMFHVGYSNAFTHTANTGSNTWWANSTTMYLANTSGNVVVVPYGISIDAAGAGYYQVGNTASLSYSNSSTTYIANSSAMITLNSRGIDVAADGNSFLNLGNTSVNTYANSTVLSTNTLLAYTANITGDMTVYDSMKTVNSSTSTWFGTTSTKGYIETTSNKIELNTNGTAGLVVYKDGGNTTVGAGVTTPQNGGLDVYPNISINGNIVIDQYRSINAASYNIGTSFVANTSGIYTNGDISFLNNNKTLRFVTLSGSANVGFRQQDDNNFVFYSTDTANNQRAVWSIFANSSTSNLNIAVPVQMTGNLTVLSNTFTLGTSSPTANGYTYLPNGLKMNWGWVSANATTGDITFASAFTSACYTVTTTPVNSASSNTPSVTAISTTGASIRSLSTAAASNVYFIAIGL